MSLLHRLSELRASGERGVLFTVVEGEGIGAKELEKPRAQLEAAAG